MMVHEMFHCAGYQNEISISDWIKLHFENLSFF